MSVIGAGIGAQHLDGYEALPEHYQIHSVCDLDAARAEPLAARYGAAYVPTLDAVLADPEVDIVDICLPPHLHLQSCLDALDAGKIVVCEKPLVGSLKEADLLAAKLQETGGILSPVFQYRYGLGTAQLRAVIKAGLTGAAYAATLETHWDRGADHYATPWRGTWAGEQGGAILIHAIHIHDLLTAFLGPVARVYADLSTRVNPVETEDCGALSLRMANGALVTSSVTLGAAGNTSRLRLMFEGVTVTSDLDPYAPARKGWTFEARDPAEQPKIDAVLAGVSEPKAGYAGMFEALAHHLDRAGDAHVRFEDGRAALELVTAVYASARSARPVEVPLPADHPLYASWLPTTE